MKALRDMASTYTANMLTTKSSPLSAASLLVPMSWIARTYMEMVGMVDLLKLEELSIVGIFYGDTAKSNWFNIQFWMLLVGTHICKTLILVDLIFCKTFSFP